MNAQANFRPLAHLVLVGLTVFLAPVARAAPPAKVLPADMQACEAAMRRFSEKPRPEGALEELVRGCSRLYAAEECRTAWERSFAIQGPSGRLPVIVHGCTRASCAQLSPRPKLCEATPRWLTPHQVLGQWPEFQRAVLAQDLGAQAAKLEPGFTTMLSLWTRTTEKPPAAQRVLRMVQVSERVELELQDAQGQRLGGWSFQELPGDAQLLELRKQAERFPKVSGKDASCVRLEVDPPIEFRQMKPIIHALTDGGCEPYALTVLVRMPAPSGR